MMQGEIYYLLIKIRRRAMVKKTAKEMLEIAIEMRKKSYAPYSNFYVRMENILPGVTLKTPVMEQPIVQREQLFSKQ